MIISINVNAYDRIYSVRRKLPRSWHIDPFFLSVEYITVSRKGISQIALNQIGIIRESVSNKPLAHPRCERIKTNFWRGRIAREVMEKSLEPRKLHTANGNGLFNYPTSRSNSSFFFIATLFLSVSSFLKRTLFFFLFFTTKREHVSLSLYVSFAPRLSRLKSSFENYIRASPARSKSNERRTQAVPEQIPE